MIGAYISDDFYFFLEDIKAFEGSRNTWEGKFVCPSNSKADVYIRMTLLISIDYGSPGKPPDSRIDLDYKKKECTLVFSEQNFQDWFIKPTEHVRDGGPDWRYASSNVYIRTIYSEKDFQSFRNSIISYMMKAPEANRPRRKST